ncbi:winged helix-turn-helix domain-containing protein [Actinomycetes bacterium KLBMP 9797]
MSGDQIRLDPMSLRGRAQPLGVRILGLLRVDGPATSTTLAERLRLSTGATSYHLRQLAAYGFVVEDTERGVGRERWWRAAHNYTTLDERTARESPAEAEAYLRAIAASYADQMNRWVGESMVQPEVWDRSSIFSDWMFRLTPDEAAELRREVEALADRYRKLDEPDPPPGTEMVAFQVQLMPFVSDGDVSDGADVSDGEGVSKGEEQ